MKQGNVGSAVLFCMSLAALSVSAATNYWDNNGAAAGFGAAGGTWGADTNWSADATGALTPAGTSTTSDDDLFFGSRALGLGAGTITVSGTNPAPRSLTFGAASGPLLLSGGALNLTAPLTKVAVQNMSNTLATVLTGTGGLYKAQAPELNTFTNFLTSSATVIYTNACLADYFGAGGVMWGGSIPTKQPVSAYFFTNSGVLASFQLQALDGGHTKCVKVELAQVGPDITARAVYAKYLLNTYQLGYNFDAGGSVGTIATSSAASGYGVAQTLLLPRTRASEYFVTASATTVLTNAPLSEIASVAASMAGGSISFGPVPATPFYFNNNGSTCTVQMQAYNGSYTKCVKLELAQSGSDITARALYVKYYNTAGSNMMGFDFDAGGTANTLATGFAGGAYGLCQLRFPLALGLTLSGVNTYAGNTKIDSGILELGGAGQLGGGTYTGAIMNAGQLVFSTAADQTLGGTLSGVGVLRKTSAGKASMSSTYGAFLTSAATVVLPMASLADCIGADGVMGGAYMNGGSGNPITGDAYHFVNTGAVATWQMQTLDGGYTKCVKVELTQSGPHLAARAVYARYVNGSQLGYDFDAGGTTEGTVATSFGTAGYGVAQTVLTLFRHSTLMLTGTNTCTGGTQIDAGTLAVTGSVASLPSGGGVTVGREGHLLLNVPGLSDTYMSVGGVNPITVNGGTLTLAARFNGGYNRPITINGGKLVSTYTENNDNGNYLNALTLMSGAQVLGYRVRVGYMSAASITVGGSSPSVIAEGLNMVRFNANPLTLNVSNVTGDAAADLLIPGVIRDYSGYENMPIVKTGSGTVSLSGVNTHAGTYTITAGTLLLATNGALNASNPVTLNGGTLSMGAYSNACGAVTVSANSVLALGSGTLAFAASTGSVWTAGATLSLTGTLSRYALRFGADQNALSAVQLSAITYNSGPVRLRADGYLAEPAKGTIIRIL